MVYKFNINGKSMVFPGDLETDGWGAFYGNNGKIGHFDYCAVSHHGSITGLDCPIPAGSMRPCSASVADKAIIMGRDGLFNGIISDHVRNCFGKPDRSSLFITSEPSNTKFLELDWAHGAIQRF